MPAGREKNFFRDDRRQFFNAFRFNRELAGVRSRNARDVPARQNTNTFLLINRRESLSESARVLGEQATASDHRDLGAEPLVTQRKLCADRTRAERRD